MPTIAPRRMPRRRPVRLCRSASRIDFMRSSTGITRSLHTIVDSAIVSTITMPVAADSPPMNTSSASASRCSIIGSVSTNVSGSTRAAAKVHDAAEGDRHDEQVHCQHVQREQPDRLGDVVLVDVLDDRDLELAGQEHDREHRQQREPGPVGVAPRGSAQRREQRRELRVLGCALRRYRRSPW